MRPLLFLAISILTACDTSVESCPDVYVVEPDPVDEVVRPIEMPEPPETFETSPAPTPWDPTFRVALDADPTYTIEGIPVIPVTCEFVYVIEPFGGGPEVAYCGWVVPSTDQMCLVGYGGQSVTCLQIVVRDLNSGRAIDG